MTILYYHGINVPPWDLINSIWEFGKSNSFIKNKKLIKTKSEIDIK
jgi:hypothetical protein